MSEYLSYFNDFDLSLIKEKLISYWPNFFEAGLAFIIICIVYFIVSGILVFILKKHNAEKALIKISKQALQIIAFVFAFVIVLKQLGVNVSSSLAGIGVLGVAIGFASQDALANMISGFFIFIDRPFKVGDYLTYQNYYGRVEEITIRSTRIRTQDNTFVVIPNNKIINDLLVDHSTNGDTRIVVPVGIAYKESVSDARAVILEAISRINKVLKTPAPDVVVDRLGDSSVELQVRVWIADASDERQVHFETTEIIKKALDEAKIDIAFPHLQLFIDDVEDAVINKLSKLNR